MVVVHDETTALMIKQILTKNNYSVSGPVKSGSEAIALLKHNQPDLLLIDTKLSEKPDGIDTVKQIQTMINIPHIFITESSDQNITDRVRQTTPYGILLKPFDKNMLCLTIDMALHKYAAEHKYRVIEKQYTAILNSLPDTIFTVNNRGEVLDDTLSLQTIWPKSIEEKAITSIQSVIKNEKSTTFEYAVKKSDRIYYYEARLVYVNSNRIITIVRDITRQKQTDYDLKRYTENFETEVSNRTRKLEKINNELVTEINFREMIESNLTVFRHAVNQSPNIIIILNKEGFVQYVNTKFTEISGYELDDLLDKSVKDENNYILPEPDTWENITGQEQWKGEIYSVSKNGKIYYLLASVFGLKDEDNNITSYIITASDITEKKREKLLMDQIKTALDKSQLDAITLEKDWKEWQEKIMNRNISRTDKSLFKNIHNSFTQGAGFGTLISLLDMLAMTLKKQDDKYIIDSTMFNLIQENVSIAKNAFKTFSNIDWIISNNFEMEIISCRELYELALGIKRKADELVQVKNQNLLINDYNAIFADLFININKEYFYKAFYEILVNAMKFSKPNSYIIIMMYHLNNNLIISTINDPEKTGDNIIGIPPEYSKVIFEPFYRLSKVVYEKFKTLDFGLGLTLVEKIITKHGGEINAQNILDHTDIRKEAQTKVNMSVKLPLLNE